MAFDEILAEVSEVPEDNSDDETLPVADTSQDEDGGGEDDAAPDNSQETGQQVGFDPNSITDPQLQAAYKQMQAAFTPRLQEAANLREQFGDLDPNLVGVLRQYQTLLRSDPFQAREFLAQHQQGLESQLGMQQQQASPFEGVEPLTQTEKALLDAGKAMWERLQQQEYITTQHKFARQQEIVERQFAQLESQYKTTIPLEERHAVWNFMNTSGVRDVGTAWKALNYDKAMQKGAQKAAKTVQKKQQQPTPPGNRQARSAPAAASSGKGLTGHFEEAWNKFGG